VFFVKIKYMYVRAKLKCHTFEQRLKHENGANDNSKKSRSDISEYC